jgi:phosphoglycolate phosphatase-like HAD superfamily hydrolase
LDNLIIFDLDGVITSEDAYWDTAGLVLHELLHSPRYWNVTNSTQAYQPAMSAEESRRISRAALPEAVLVDFKARSINSNWDTCYAGMCLYLIGLLAAIPDKTPLLPLRPADADWLAALRGQLAAARDRELLATDIFAPFHSPLFEGLVGVDLLEQFNVYAGEVVGQPVVGVFGRYSPSWWFCEDIFQEWYLGEELYTREYGHAPAQPGKPGCVLFEEPLLPLERLDRTLKTLRERGYTLGIDTGRPGPETTVPLKRYDLLRYFDQRHMMTHTEVALAEAVLRTRGDTTSLVKPHPYSFAHAANPDYQPGERVVQPRGSFVVVGDSTSDIIGGRAAGAMTVAVLTGARTPQARALLEQSAPDFIIPDVTELPALLTRLDSLATIQHLQFSEREKAELLLQRWLARYMHLQTEQVTLMPKAVSLNSFNGFYRMNSEEYFFKTHVEEQGVLPEYYNAELLHGAGYNIVRPLRTLREQGRQMVIYPVVHQPVLFDLLRALETGGATTATLEALAEAERRECERLLAIYKATLAFSTAEEHAQAPIHQLFWHRLAGARLKHFYLGKGMLEPATTQSYVPFHDVLAYHWIINGVAQPYTLDELIARATSALDPAQPMMTIIGHGDAHFGNVFLADGRDYLYFDPAFAGRHSPLLDIVKPLFHNVFATWMYFPREVGAGLQLNVIVEHSTKSISVTHNYALTRVRQAIAWTKLRYLVQPLITWLRSVDALPDNWQEMIQSALMCCPLLTVNLLDQERIAPAAVAWLGLVQAVLVGNTGLALWETGLFEPQ